MRIHNRSFIFWILTFLCYNLTFVYSRVDDVSLGQNSDGSHHNQDGDQTYLDKYDLKNPGSELTPKLVEVLTVEEGSSFHKANDTNFYNVDEHPYSFYFRFNFKAKCVQVSYKHAIVWRQSHEYDNETPNEIFFAKKQKHISVDLPSFYLTYEYANNEWILKSLKRKSVFATELTIFTADDKFGTNLEKNLMSKYDIYKYEFVVQYQMKKNVYCMEFRCKDMTVWKYNPEKPELGFPRSIYLHTDFGLIFAEFENVTSIYRCTNESCKLLTKHNMGSFSYSHVRVFTEDPEDPGKLKENDSNQFRRKSYGYSQIFHMKEGAKCKELKYKDDVLWYYGYKTKEEYPKGIYVNFFFKMIALEFSKFKMVYMYLDRWRYVCKLYPEPFTEDQVTILTQNDKNSSTTDTNDKSKYDVTKYPHDYALMFNFKPGTKCVGIKFKKKSIWKHNPKKLGDNYPEMIYLNKDLRMIFVSSQKFFNIYVKFDKWREVMSSKDKDILKKRESLPMVETKDKETPKQATEITEYDRSSLVSDSETSDSESELSDTDSESDSSDSSSESDSSSVSGLDDDEEASDVVYAKSLRPGKYHKRTRSTKSRSSAKKTKDDESKKPTPPSETDKKEDKPVEKPKVEEPPRDGPRPSGPSDDDDDDEDEEEDKSSASAKAKAKQSSSSSGRKIFATTIVVIIICLLLVLMAVGLGMLLKKRKSRASTPLLPGELEV